MNGFTDGLVTLQSVQDTRANVVLIDGMTDSEVLMNTAVVTVTDAVSKAQADTLNGFTNAKVTLNSVEDTYDNIQLIKDIGNAAVDMDAAAVKVTDDVNKTKVDDLRTDTTGDITLTSVTEDKTDLATINGYTDVILSTANITVSDDVSKAEADTINAYNDQIRTVTLTSITDNFTNVVAAQGTVGIVMTAATIETDNTEAVTKANVDTLNDFTTGVVTVKSVRDTRANVEAIDLIDDGLSLIHI